jgi:hypothetical protein
MHCTLGVDHLVDLPPVLFGANAKKRACAPFSQNCAKKVFKTFDVFPHFLNGIISINEKETFRDKLLAE